jgi:hypothetical protein
MVAPEATRAEAIEKAVAEEAKKDAERRFLPWKEGREKCHSNPCRYVDRYPENRCERFLSGEELGRLGEALAAAGREAST